MFDFFIFSTVMLVVAIISYYKYRKKGFNADRVNKSGFYTAMIFITLCLSTLCNLLLLLNLLNNGSKLLITIAIWYLVFDFIHILMSLYKLFGRKFWSFYYDISYAVDRIVSSNPVDRRNNVNYSKKSEINALLDEVVEEVNSTDSLSSDKTEEENASKDSILKKDVKKGKKSILGESTTHNNILNDREKSNEKERIRNERRLAYEKEQKDIDEILSFLDAKGL